MRNVVFGPVNLLVTQRVRFHFRSRRTRKIHYTNSNAWEATNRGNADAKYPKEKARSRGAGPAK